MVEPIWIIVTVGSFVSTGIMGVTKYLVTSSEKRITQKIDDLTKKVDKYQEQLHNVKEQLPIEYVRAEHFKEFKKTCKNRECRLATLEKWRASINGFSMVRGKE